MRLAGLDAKILALYAGRDDVRDIASHLEELYGVELGADTISTVTDAVLEDVQAWRMRPLDPVYPIGLLRRPVGAGARGPQRQKPRLLSGHGRHRRRRARDAGIW